MLNLDKEIRKKFISEAENYLLVTLSKKIAEMSNKDIGDISLNQIDTAYKILKDMRNIIKPIEDNEIDPNEIRNISVVLPDDWGIAK